MRRPQYQYDVYQPGEDVDFLDGGIVKTLALARSAVEAAFAKHPNAIHAEVFNVEWNDDPSVMEWEIADKVADYKRGTGWTS